MGDKLKVTVLYDVWGEEETPPADAAETGRKRKVKEDREEIFDALTKLGHEPSYHVLDGRPQSLYGLSKCGADLIFNLTESYAGDDTMEDWKDPWLPVPVLGDVAGHDRPVLFDVYASTSRVYVFVDDKPAGCAELPSGQMPTGPVTVVFGGVIYHGAIDEGVAEAVVSGVKELMERVEYVQNEFDSPALIEEYIEGREIYAGILGSYERAEVLPLVELDLSKLPEGTPKIASRDVKFETGSRAYKVTKSRIAEDLDEPTLQKLSETALAAYRAVKLRDYGRIDMRLTPEGEVYVIEANPNPWLSSKHEFAMAAKKSGRTYTQLIGEIVELALERDRRSKAAAT